MDGPPERLSSGRVTRRVGAEVGFWVVELARVLVVLALRKLVSDRGRISATSLDAVTART